MPRQRVKIEPPEPSAASSMISGTMAPPSVFQRPDASNISVAQSFIRSGAPSAETRLYDEDPQLLQMRPRAQSNGSGGVGRHGSPSSQIDLQQSFTHTSFTDIGLKLKACNDTLGELQQLGIQHVAHLPELVLVGDQSAGKSSLMSGLAELNLPRSGGVCTRCPIHIRLSRNREPHWSCTVSLQQEYDYRPPPNGHPIKKNQVTKSNPFPPWVQIPRVVKTFKTIYDKSEIEETLRWAQVAILNPNSSFELYVPGEGACAKETPLAQAVQETEAQFSPNIVALEIKGPNLPDLSFYDLPGVFLSPPQEADQYLVSVVSNLTSHYIKRPQAIIVWALPMNADPENSISLGIIREAKAQDRTIGVMTKADKLPLDNTAPWIAMLKGEKHPIGQGYFITSRPPDQGLDGAAKWEESFFQGLSTWPNEFQEFHDRCGVEPLKDFLSKQLGDSFSSSLPMIKQKVYERLRDIQHRLSQLPELPANVEHEVRTSLYRFYDAVRQAIKHPDFQSEWGTLNKQFQMCILKMKPICKVKDNEPAVIDLSEEDDAASVATDTPSRHGNGKRPRASDSTIRATPKRARTTDPLLATPVKQESFTGQPTPTQSMRGTPMPPEVANSPFAEFYPLCRPGLDIQDIRRVIAQHNRAGMPSNLIPPEVYNALVLEAVRKWDKPFEKYMDLTIDLFSRVVHNSLRESMSTLSRRMIFTQSQQHLQTWIIDMESRQRAKLKDLYDAETYQMFMTDDESYKRYRDREEEGIKRMRAISRLRNAGELWDYTPPNWEHMSAEQKSKEHELIAKNLSKLGEDPYAAEIGVASVVRGYYVLAAMRFVESVTLSVNARLFRDVANHSLNFFLDDNLGLNRGDSSVYELLMEEDVATASQRDHLKREKQKLNRAMESINDLETSFGGAAAVDALTGLGSGFVVNSMSGDGDSAMDDVV